MAAAMLAPKLGGVGEETGRSIENRRLRIGISSKELAERAGIHRATLAKVEDGDPDVRPLTISKVERALAHLEHELGIDAPLPAVNNSSDDLIEVQGTNPQGFSYVVRGPLRDREELEKSLKRLLEQMGKE